MKRILSITISMVTFLVTYAQDEIKEQVYLHLNAQTIMSGETLYFSAYCNNLKSGDPSELSKILYVEIVGEEGAVHQQKVRLNKGKGHADFFVNSIIPSGQYYIIAYTRWMKNFEDFYQAPLVIINPYESYSNPAFVTTPIIEFYPEGNSLINEVENTLAFQIQTINPTQLKGRMVNDNGEIIQQFQADDFGLGSFDFTPKSGESYQVVLEDSVGNLSFFDLPGPIDSGSFIDIQEETDALSVMLTTTSQPNNVQVDFEVLSNGTNLYASTILPNRPRAISKDQLADGLLRIRYFTKDGEVIAERNVLMKPSLPSNNTTSKSYGKREMADRDFDLDSGIYSISVRKKLNTKQSVHSHSIWKDGLNEVIRFPVNPYQYITSESPNIEALLLASDMKKPVSTLTEVKWLPEIREEILTGSVYDSLGNPVSDEKIAITFPGDPYQLRIGSTNEEGEFVVPYKSPFQDYKAYITSLDFQSEWEIEVEDPFLSEYPDFDFTLPYLDSTVVKELLKKSVRNQIENAYYEAEAYTPSLNEWAMNIPFEDTYVLNNYERFPSLKETFTEYIVSANVRERRDDVIRTTYFPGLGKEDLKTLVLLDGVPVSGASIIEYDPLKVESISVLPNRYFLGTHVMDGIVEIMTRQKDLGGFNLGNIYETIDVMGAAEPIAYSFAGPSEDHLPAQNDQLFWDPSNHNGSFKFFTSDVEGEFEIVIEGFSAEGTPVSIVETFLVD